MCGGLSPWPTTAMAMHSSCRCSSITSPAIPANALVFYRDLPLQEAVSAASGAGGIVPAPTEMLDALYRLILIRRDTGADTSYVKSSFSVVRTSCV